MKLLERPVRWLFVACLPLLLLSTGIAVTVNSLWLYGYGFERYGVGRITGLSPTELERVAAGLISYWNSGDEYIRVEVTKDGNPLVLFNDREVRHLKDVKGLIRMDYWILLGTLAFIVVYTGVLLWQGRRRELGRGLMGGGGLTLLLVAGLGLGMLLGFDWLWPRLHLLGFSNDLWQLDPARDYLIMLITEGFQRDAALFCAGATSLAAAALVAGGWRLVKHSPPGQQPATKV